MNLYLVFLIVTNFLLSVWGIKFQSYKCQKMILENNNTKQSQYFIKVPNRKATIYIIILVLLFLLFIPYLSLAGNIIVYTPNQGTNREKYFSHIIYQRNGMPTLVGNKHPSVHFFLHGPRLFHLSTEKSTVRSVGNGHQSGYSRADIKYNNINKRSKLFPYRELIQ